MRETPAEIGGIKVTDTIKYLGIKIDNKRNYLKTHKIEMTKKAQRFVNLIYSVIEKSCNKIYLLEKLTGKMWPFLQYYME